MTTIPTHTIASATVRPETHLAVLSASEVHNLCAAQNDEIYDIFRRCALAVLTSGADVDDARVLSQLYRDLDVRIEQADRGILLHLTNAPATAFVDDEMIAGAQEHLFSVLRDIVFVANDTSVAGLPDDAPPGEITNAVFRILRQANLLHPGKQPGLVVCWGGHAIGPIEYDYAKEVGYQLGLRKLNVCTGCGPGAMKGPMKGATIAHAKQRIRTGRYIGITEPGIIAAEAPNPIVNQLSILPDIEKRLEAFVRLAHGVIVFPGGAGTAEEILYLLGVLAHPNNVDHPFPLIFTGPRSSEGYFQALDKFIRDTLGDDFAQKYQIIIDSPSTVASVVKTRAEEVLNYRDAIDDAPYFNWSLTVDGPFQQPFQATHEAMKSLQLNSQIPRHELACNLRRAFSGIVAGNVKEEGINAVEAYGPFELHADSHIASALDTLLRTFVADGRMRLPGRQYIPSYTVVS